MKRSALLQGLALSLLLNVGVLAAVGYHAVQLGRWPVIFGEKASEESLPDHLKLSAEQRRRWHDLEVGFLHEIEGDWRKIRDYREAMIRELFSDRPVLGRIEAERSIIAQVQTEQQRRVIEQLLRERDILDPAQRRALAELLIRQAPSVTAVERLHGQ